MATRIFTGLAAALFIVLALGFWFDTDAQIAGEALT